MITSTVLQALGAGIDAYKAKFAWLMPSFSALPLQHQAIGLWRGHWLLVTDGALQWNRLESNKVLRPEPHYQRETFLSRRSPWTRSHPLSRPSAQQLRAYG